jgi:hypothetical protein
MNTSIMKNGLTPAEHITARIAELTDWRGLLMFLLHELIHASDPHITEEWKWDTPVWSHAGNVVSIAAFQDHVKLNFFMGAFLPDPHGLFNAGLDARTSRAIDFHQGDILPEAALKELIRAAVDYNLGKARIH